MNSGFKCVLSSLGLFAARVGAAALMILGHGWSKIEKYNDLVEKFPDPLNIGSKWSLIGAIAGEVVCPALVAIGLFTRLSTLGVVFTMAVAAFVFHQNDVWFMAQAEKGAGSKEMALLYMTLFALFFFTGPGKISLDGLIFRGRKNVVVTPDVKPASTRPL